MNNDYWDEELNTDIRPNTYSSQFGSPYDEYYYGSGHGATGNPYNSNYGPYSSEGDFGRDQFQQPTNNWYSSGYWGGPQSYQPMGGGWAGGGEGAGFGGPGSMGGAIGTMGGSSGSAPLGSGQITNSGAQLGGAIGAVLSNNPYKQGMPALDQIPEVARQDFATDRQEAALNPWIQRGTDAANLYSDQTSSMAKDPAGFVNDLLAKYQKSPSFDFEKKEAIDAANAAAAAGGLEGLPGVQESLEDRIQKLSSRDAQQWLNNVMGEEKTGLGGLQYLSGQGFQGSRDLAQLISQLNAEKARMMRDYYLAKSGLKIASGREVKNQNEALGSALGSFGDMVPNMFGSMMGGGGGGGGILGMVGAFL